MILLILLDGSPFLIIGNFIEGIIFIMIIPPPTSKNYSTLVVVISLFLIYCQFILNQSH